MAKSVPINSLNAIASAGFVVSFDRSFSDKEDKKLLTLKDTLRQDLPNFSQGMTFGAKVENDKIIEQTAKKSGVILQRIEPDGSTGWMLQVMENQVIVNCHAYDRWANVWKTASKFFQASFDLLDLKSLKVQFCVLQYVDKFIGDQEDYNLFDVFDKKTKFLTQNASDAGKFWHVHQGWFMDSSEEERILNVLNLGSASQQEKIVTSIDHAVHRQFLKNKPAKELLGAEGDDNYESIFFDLHTKNKDVLRSLLNKKQIKAVKLDG